MEKIERREVRNFLNNNLKLIKKHTIARLSFLFESSTKLFGRAPSFVTARLGGLGG